MTSIFGSADALPRREIPPPEGVASFEHAAAFNARERARKLSVMDALIGREKVRLLAPSQLPLH